MTTEETLLKTDDLVRRGVHMAEARRASESLAALEEAVRLSPDHALGRLHLSMVLAGEGRFEEAVPHLRRALELRPDSVAFHLFAGRVFFDAGGHESARKEFRRALEINPANDLAKAYDILSRWAAGAPEAASELNPDDLPDSTPFLARLLALIEKTLEGRPVEYVDEKTPVPFLDRPRMAYVLWRAGIAQKGGRLDEAAAYSDMALEMHPGLPAAVKSHKECREASLGVARRGVEEEPASVEARVGLAGHLADAEKYEEAERELNEARRLATEAGNEEPVKAPAVLRLAGRIAYGLRRIDQALELVRAGMEPGFTMSETHYLLGLCHLAQGRWHLCYGEFELLVAKVWWAVPLRCREFLERERAKSRSSEAVETRT